MCELIHGKRELPEKKYKKGIMTVDKKGFVGTDAPLRILTRNYKSGQITGRFIITFYTSDSSYLVPPYLEDNLQKLYC